MGLLTRELIQDGRLLKRERVKVDELECDVIVTELPAGEVVGISQKASPLEILVKVLVDENGKRVFGDDDAAFIGKNIPVAVATNLVNVSLRLSGMDGGVKEKN